MANDTTPLNVVAVGASAGGVEALTQFAAGLPANLPYAVLVTLHMLAGGPSVLAHILDRTGPLPARQAVDGTPLQAGTIHVSIPNHHLLAHDGRMLVTEGPTENGHRPAINALFRSVAVAYGQRAVGVLLSGVLDDGLLGLAAIRSRGGTTIAQSPSDALFPTLPRNAIDAGVVDHEVPAAEVGGLLKQLADREFEDRELTPDAKPELDNRIAMARLFPAEFGTRGLGPPAEFSSPDCHGALVGVSDGNYRCPDGHAWTLDALLRTRAEEVEGTLRVAVHSLQEKARRSRRLAGRVTPGMLSEWYAALAEKAKQAMSILSHHLTEAHSKQGGRAG